GPSALRRSEMAVRAQAGRDPGARIPLDGPDPADHSTGPRRGDAVSGAAHDPRAGGPGERGDGWRDRGLRRGREELLRGSPAADEPGERTRDQADRQAD